MGGFINEQDALPGGIYSVQTLDLPAAADPKITLEELKKVLPSNHQQAVTQSLVDKLNALSSDPLAASSIRENFIGYVHVLQDGRFKTEDYLNAVTYVSYKLMGMSNRDAYEKTFPSRMAEMTLTGKSSSEIAAYVSIYAKGKLVNLIYEQSVIPSWVLNQDAFQEAINTQLRLMRTATSEKVQSDAANSILTHLKKPEVKEMQLAVTTKEGDGLKAIQEGMRQLAEQQQDLIRQGTPTHLIAAQPLIEEGEYTDVDNNAG